MVTEGELPAGRARNAEPDIDWGVERIPTFCVLDFDVALPARPSYRLRLDRVVARRQPLLPRSLTTRRFAVRRRTFR